MSDMESETNPEKLDLRGVRCPLNWARARVRLEELGPGAHLVLLVDDPRSVRDLPRAAEACGYHAAEVLELSPGLWQIDVLA
jgi:tRNA 2-thiouridine synthesizing protein A